jgi:hypothetical protein
LGLSVKGTTLGTIGHNRIDYEEKKARKRRNPEGLMLIISNEIGGINSLEQITNPERVE